MVSMELYAYIQCTFYTVHGYQFYFATSHKLYEYSISVDYNITFLNEIARQADHKKGSYRQNKCAN